MPRILIASRLRVRSGRSQKWRWNRASANEVGHVARMCSTRRVSERSIHPDAGSIANLIRVPIILPNLSSSNHVWQKAARLARNSKTELSGLDNGSTIVYSVPLGGDEHRLTFRHVHATRPPPYLGFAMGYCRHIGRTGELAAMQVF